MALSHATLPAAAPDQPRNDLLGTTHTQWADTAVPDGAGAVLQAETWACDSANPVRLLRSNGLTLTVCP